MIRLENVSVNFNEFKALDTINCSLNQNDFILLVGHNGAGKSTLLDVISGKVIPNHGKIFRNNLNITNISEQKKSLFVSRVFQNTHMGSVASLSIRENLCLTMLKQKKTGFKLLKNNFPEFIVDEIIKPLGLRLENLLDTPIGKLSGGQRQIITIIMATLNQPDVLLLDEPTAALDPISSQLVLQFLEKFTHNKNIATVMITHDEKEAEFLCQKKWFLSHGILTTQ